MKEQIYTINLGKQLKNTPRWRRSRRAMNIIRNYLKKHMKAEKVKIGKSITESVWKRGDQKPPSKIRIKAILTDEDIVKAEILGVIFPEELKKPEKKKEKKEEKKEEVKEEKKPEKKEEKPKEEKKEEPKGEKSVKT